VDDSHGVAKRQLVSENIDLGESAHSDSLPASAIPPRAGSHTRQRGDAKAE